MLKNKELIKQKKKNFNYSIYYMSLLLLLLLHTFINVIIITLLPIISYVKFINNQIEPFF